MQTLKRLGIFLLCGFALVVGGYLGLIVLGMAPTSEPSNYVEYPKDLTIHDLRLSPVTDNLTVVGKISNSSSKTYRPVFVDLDVLSGDSVIFRCRQADMPYVPPASTIDFQMTCSDAKVAKLPAGVTFRATVNSASFR